MIDGYRRAFLPRTKNARPDVVMMLLYVCDVDLCTIEMYIVGWCLFYKYRVKMVYIESKLPRRCPCGRLGSSW